ATICTVSGQLHQQCPRAFGDYPDGNGCVTFLRCWRGQPYQMRCPGGMAFDPANSRCVNQQQVACVQNNQVAGPLIGGNAPGAPAAIGQLQQPSINQVQVAGFQPGSFPNGGLFGVPPPIQNGNAALLPQPGLNPALQPAGNPALQPAGNPAILPAGNPGLLPPPPGFVFPAPAGNPGVLPLQPQNPGNPGVFPPQRAGGNAGVLAGGQNGGQAGNNAAGVVLIGYSVAQSPFCPAPNGDFPNPASETCSAFFRCVDGRPIALRCPSEQTFDFLQLSCRPSDDVDCERQLQLYANPHVFLDWLYGRQNGIGATFPSLKGQDGNQINPNLQNALFGLNNLPLPQGTFPQQNSLGGGVQGNAGVQGTGALNGFAQSQGTGAPDLGLLSPDPFSRGVLVQGTQPVEGAPPAIGRLYPTAQGTVIVIPKQPGQSQVQIPNIQRIDTVTVSIQPGQATTPSPQPAQAQPAQPVQPNAPPQS
ncbi:hypothetical protein BaRGS_00014659, partial [Batillaria attramentaria]